MADVTDAAFRRVIAKYSKWGGNAPSVRVPGLAQRGGPHAMWTEFVSADGLVLRPVRESVSEDARSDFQKLAFSNGIAPDNPLLADLLYSEAERPIVAQFFSGRPEMMEKAAALARELGFDGVDINMGCPDTSIEKQGAGAAHIKNPILAKEIIAAAKQGAQDLPVSVKTRLGYNKDELETWLPALLETGLAAVTFHARTRKEMSKVPAHWDRVKRAVEIRNEIAPETLIVGNGDVLTLSEAQKKADETSADGIMLGKAIFGNPWLFADLSHAKRGRQIERPAAILPFDTHDPYKKEDGKLYPAAQSRNSAERSEWAADDKSRKIAAGVIPSVEERLKVMVEHTKLFEKLLPHKNFAIMKKHYKAYVKDFDKAAELRAQLMEASNAETVERIVGRFLKTL